MKLIDCYSSTSKLHGTGLFAGRDIERAAVVLFWPPTDVHDLIQEKDLGARVSQEPRLKSTLCRLVGSIFVASEHLQPDEMVNHSDDPNLVYVFGVCIARRNIPMGEELTIDYRYLGSPLVPEEIGEKNLTAHSAKEATLRALDEICSLLSMADNGWPGRDQTERKELSGALAQKGEWSHV